MIRLINLQVSLSPTPIYGFGLHPVLPDAFFCSSLATVVMTVISKLNDLNPDCLLAIFKWAPFQEQLVRLRSVCQLWKKLVEKMFLKRKSLILIMDGEYYFQRSGSKTFFWLTVDDRRRLALKAPGNDDHLRIQLLSKTDQLVVNGFQHFLHTLAELMPQIEQLVFSSGLLPEEIFFASLLPLLTRWSNLEGLTIAGYITAKSDFSWLPLLKVLNSLKFLKRLEMLSHVYDADGNTVRVTPSFESYSSEISFIARLEYFLCSFNLNTVDDYLPLFSSKCQRLHAWNLASASSLKTVTPSLTHLALYGLNGSNFEITPLIEDISSRFLSLEYLDFCFFEKEIPIWLFRHLRQLKKLTELRLMAGYFNLRDTSFNVFSLPTVERVQFNKMGIAQEANSPEPSLVCKLLAVLFPNMVEFEIDSFDTIPQLASLLDNTKEFTQLRKVQSMDDVFKEYGMHPKDA